MPPRLADLLLAQMQARSHVAPKRLTTPGPSLEELNLIFSAAAQAPGLTGAANAAAGGLQGYQQNQVLQAILAQNQNVAQKPTA